MRYLRDVAEEEQDAYIAKVDALWDEYRPRFEAKLGRYVEAFEAAGWKVDGEPYDSSDEEYEMGLAAVAPNGEAADVHIILLESACRDGSLDGVAFGIVLDAKCGHVIGGLTPYNYSPELWVSLDSPADILERWQIIDDSSEDEVVYVLDEHLAEDRDGGAS